MTEHIQFRMLRNIGKFDSVIPTPQTELNKLALIYAENGRGKTTIATILRSLSTNNSTLITERHRLGAQHTPHVVINVNNQSYIFQNGSWSEQFSGIAVFDDNFVAQNVCSGIEITIGNRQNLHELILGAQGVSLNEALQTHVHKIEEHNRILREKEVAIPASARGMLSVGEFCALVKNDGIDIKIQEAERNLAAAHFSDAIKQQSNFLPLELPSFDTEGINSVLQLDLPGLQAEAAARVHQHFTKIGRGAEAWIGDGMQRIGAASVGKETEICPFCTQPLKNSSLIAHYERYFSQSYGALKREISHIGKVVAEVHENENPTAFERAVRMTIQSAEFWRKFMEVPAIEIDTVEIAISWKAAREAVLAILRTKLASPLEKMNLSLETMAAIAVYDNHRAAIADFSLSLQNINTAIALIKERAAAADITTLSNDLAKLKINKLRHSPTIDPLCRAYLDEKEAKKATEAKRDNARRELDRYRASIFGQYEAAINNYLIKFNAEFRLSSITSVNSRGGSSCTYNVLINEITVPINMDTGPSFKNTLSAGDRNTLALAFFFASLDKDPLLAQKIVVIDDPMSSLDEHRSLATIQELRDLVNRVRQVIVLSHSKPFLCQIWEWADKTSRSALKISRSGRSSVIDTWDVHQDCITEHDKRYLLVVNYINGGNSPNQREVATALRPILEAFLRVAYPIYFTPGTLLGKFHRECLNAIELEIPIMNNTYTHELRQLLDYVNKFHHETNLAYATEVINDGELLNHCKRVLKFVQKLH